jgi:hypothetical protein
MATDSRPRIIADYLIDEPIPEQIGRYGTELVGGYKVIGQAWAEDNAALMAAAPWYRVLALIACNGDWFVRRIEAYRDKKDGWRVGVRNQRWAWEAGVDPFGCPVPPPEKMFLEIKQAIENL